MTKKKTNGTTTGLPTNAKPSIMEWKRSETFTSYYTNNTHVETGAWDVRFRFGLVDEIDKANNVVHSVQVAEVRMSLEHAKRIHAILTEQLEQYEKRFGKLPTPPSAGESNEP